MEDFKEYTDTRVHFKRGQVEVITSANTSTWGRNKGKQLVQVLYELDAGKKWIKLADFCIDMEADRKASFRAAVYHSVDVIVGRLAELDAGLNTLSELLNEEKNG